MIVVDASALLALLLGHDGAETVAEQLTDAGEVAAPHLIDAEVGQVLRRFVAAGALDAERATAAIDDLLDLPLVRFPHYPLLRRAFALRHNVTMYDALYLALAEALVGTLLTGDSALARVPGCDADVHVVAPAAP